MASNCSARYQMETGIYIPGFNSTIRDCDVTNSVGAGISLEGAGNLVESSFIVANNQGGNPNWGGVVDTGTLTL